MTDIQRLAQEAFQHGRTQERLREAVEALRSILVICRGPKPSASQRLLSVEAEAGEVLKRLSKSTGAVIDDMEPMTGSDAEAAGKREYLRVTDQLGEDQK